MKRLENGNFELTEQELKDYMHSGLMLSYIEAAGVDNWEGYSYIYEMLEEDTGSDDFWDVVEIEIKNIK